MTQKQLSYDQLRVAPADVYEQMGYHGAQPDPATQRETLALAGEVACWLRPRFGYVVVRGRLDAAGTLLVGQTSLQTGATIARQLRGAEAFALFVATAGAEFERFQRQLQREGDMVRTYIADALGSVLAEKCADAMEQHLQESVDKLGWRHTNRFSPGYCGWHVSQQQLLFPLLGEAEPCGVSLTESSLMVPIKSVSGVIGLGPAVERLPYACALCRFPKCYKRRQPAQGR